MERSSEFLVSDDLNDRLLNSLRTFLQLYDEQKDVFEQASGRLTQAASHVSKNLEPVKDEVTKGLFFMFGGTVGAICGGVTGGVWGTYGALFVATNTKLLECATAGEIVGSILGAAVSGAFSSSIGSAVDAVAHVSGGLFHGRVRSTVWFTLGCVTGGTIGYTCGGVGGAAGGAIGGGFGTLHATSISIRLLECMVGCAVTDEKGKLMERKKKIQKTGDDFSKSIKPLVEQLKTVQTISDKMAASHILKSVAGQVETTLTALTLLEETLSDVQRAADLPQFSCRVEEAVRQCEKIPEELKKMRAAVEVLD